MIANSFRFRDIHFFRMLIITCLLMKSYKNLLVNAEIPLSWDLKSGDFFLDQHPLPTEFVNATPPGKFLFFIWTPPPPHWAISWEKRVYLSGTSICWILKQLGSRLYSCLQWTACILQENEARNWNTSTRSQWFWNFGTYEAEILVFCGQLIQTSFYPGVLVTHTGEWVIGSVSGWLMDNPEELA